MDPDTIRCWRDADDANNTRVYYNITSDQWNCAEHYGTCDSCPRLQADPDIAGVGVIAAFLVSAGLTALLGIIFTLLTPVRSGTEITDCRTLDNILASLLNEPIARLIGEKHTEKISKIIYDMVMCLGDQQLIIALALLVATMKKLYVDKSLSVFHLRLLVNLVFLSTTAFGYRIISWRVMRERGFYGKNTPSENNQESPQSFWWHLRERLPIATRASLVFTLYILLLYTGWITAKTYGLEMNCPALCYQGVAYNPHRFKGNFLVESWIFIFAFFGYCFLQVSSTKNKERISEEQIETKRKGRIRGSWFWRRQTCAACLSIAFVSYVFGFYLARTFNIWGGRTRSRFAEDIKDEMSLGFGQIVPLFLLIQPLLQLLDSIREHYRENEKKPEEEVASENVTISNEAARV